MSTSLRTTGILFVGVLLAAFAVALAPGSAEATRSIPTFLAICKHTEPDKAMDDFTFQFRRVNSQQGANQSVSDGECVNLQMTSQTDNASWTLRESSIPAGWLLKDVQCTTSGNVVTTWNPGSRDVTFTIADYLTQGVTCDFLNHKGGQIRVAKKTVPALDPNPFAFSLLLGPSTAPVVTRADGQALAYFGTTDYYASNAVMEGGYDIVETVAGYDLTNVLCTSTLGTATYTPDLVNAKASVQVGVGERLDCTFTNTKRGEIIIKKVVVADDPDYMDESFDFTFTPPAPNPPSTFALTNGQSWPTGLIPPENYTVEEQTKVGWETTWSCSDGANGAGGKIDMILTPGEKLECTFTNTLKAGKIRIVKQTEPDGNLQTFDITIKDPQGVVVKNCPAVGDDGKCTTGLLNPGVGYKASEVKVPGWDLAQNYGQIVCSNGSKANNIIVDPGKTTVCTFTNWKRGKITVSKVAIPDVAGAALTFDFTLSGAPINAFSNWPNLTLPYAFQLNGGGMWESVPWLKAGTYSVVETPPAGGWFLQSAICHQAGSGEVVRAVSDPSSIYLGPGAEVSCTFTNINPPPANLKLSRLKVPENKPVGTLVGYLTASDPGDIVSFALSPVDGTAATAGNNFFQIVKAGSQWKLLTKVVFDYERQKASSIVVEATDSANNVTKKQFVISILNVRDPN